MKKIIASLIVCACLFLSGKAWASTELDLYRTWKQYSIEYGVKNIAKSDVNALKKSASKNPSESVRLACYYQQKQQYDEAFAALSQAADKNDPDGILLKGVAHLTGVGTKDKAKGVGFIQKSARAGHPVAQYLLASMYQEGYEVSGNPKESKNWYAKALEQGMNAEVLTHSGKFGPMLAAWRGSTAATPKPSAPSTPPSQAASAPESKEKAVSKVQYKDGAVMPSPKGVSLAMLQNAWDRLSRATGLSSHLVYDDQDILNAFITKNKEGDFEVVVYRGLLNIFSTEDEIAGVLGHEIGHGMLDHLEKGRNNQAGINVAASVLSNLLGKNALADIALSAGAGLAKNGYSREAEVEADDYGTEYSAKAGYSAWGLYNSVQRMAEAGAVTPPSGFNSHPPTERRTKRLKEKAQYWEKQLRQEPAVK